MRAYAVPASHAAPALTEISEPTPGPGEVLVRVAASSVNGFDASVAAGYLVGMMEHRYPVVLGKDFAGSVSALGEGVTRFAVGDAVFGVVTKAFLGDGGLGELVAVSAEDFIAPLPEGLDMASAGALGLAGTTALDALAAAGVRSGSTVLVSGATGGVGTFAVQYAAQAGATVIATARPGVDADLVLGLGAAHVVDHTGDLPAQVRVIAPSGVDAVLHLAGEGPALVQLLTAGGRLTSVLGYGAQAHPAAVFVMANPTAATLERLGADVASGAVLVPITQTFALREANHALAALANHPRGKIAVSIA